MLENHADMEKSCSNAIVLDRCDMQKIKQIGMVTDATTEEGSKLAIMGALNLYLDFVNLFLFMLRFLGNRN